MAWHAAEPGAIYVMREFRRGTAAGTDGDKNSPDRMKYCWHYFVLFSVAIFITRCRRSVYVLPDTTVGASIHHQRRRRTLPHWFTVVKGTKYYYAFSIKFLYLPVHLGGINPPYDDVRSSSSLFTLSKPYPNYM